MPTPLWTFVAWVQGIYFIVTGIWPLVSMSTFERVTGPKVDKWLVKTVGLLITVIGAAILVGAYRRQATPELLVLAIGNALILSGVDTWYVARGRIARIYLLDAVAELILIACWIVALAIA